MPKATKQPADAFDAALKNAVKKYQLDDSAAYESGAPFNGIEGITLFVKLAGNSNREYLRAIHKCAESHKGLVEKMGEGSQEARAESNKMMAGIFADTVVVGVEVCGQPVEYNSETKAKIIEMLCQIPEKLDELVIFAGQTANFRRERLKVAEKN